MKPKVICSHGFGTRADGRGMFTDIARELPEYEFITFDYNEVDADGNATVLSLHAQAACLSEQIKDNPETEVLLCHSQGCIIAALANLGNIKKVIFLAPPAVINIDRFRRKFFHREGANYVDGGISSLPRRDGTTTYVTPEYVESIRNVDIPELYTRVADNRNLTIIRALDDEILGETEYGYLGGNVKVTGVKDASHDFKDKSRTRLGDELKKIL
jgi:hypothetical protein